MSASATFKFLGYELRPATEADLELARNWTAADDTHREIIAPGFWLEQEAGVDCYLFSDSEGPLFFFRMQRAVRLLIQFSPGLGSEGHASRMRKGLEDGVRWLEMALPVVGVGEIIFDSASILLRRFVTGKLGFAPQRNALTKSARLSVARPATRFPMEGFESLQQGRLESLQGTLQGGE